MLLEQKSLLILYISEDFYQVSFKRRAWYIAVACRRGHQGIQSIPKILTSNRACNYIRLRCARFAHMFVSQSVACIPRYFCYGPPLVYRDRGLDCCPNTQSSGDPTVNGYLDMVVVSIITSLECLLQHHWYLQDCLCHFKIEVHLQ